MTTRQDSLGKPADAHAASWRAVLLALVPAMLWVFALADEAVYDGLDMNDLAMHRQLLQLAMDGLRDGNLGLDAWYDGCCLGAPMFRNYQYLGHFAAAVLGKVFSIGSPTMLLHGLIVLACGGQCLAFYFASKRLGFSTAAAVAAAWLGPLTASTIEQGHELGSYIATGKGLFTQALALPPLVMVFGAAGGLLIEGRRFSWRCALGVGFWVGLTFGIHHLYGYFACMVLGLALLLGVAMKHLSIKSAVAYLFVPLAALLLTNSYQALSFFQDRSLFVASNVWFGANRVDGYGLGQVVKALGSGALFDDGRWPVFTLLVLAGLLARRRWEPSPNWILVTLIFLISLLLLAGRTTFGGVINLIPGMSEAHMERFAGLAHIAGTFLAGLGAIGLWRLVSRWRPAARFGWLLPAMLIAYLVNERLAVTTINHDWLVAQEDANAIDVASDPVLNAATRSGGGRFFGYFCAATQHLPRRGAIPYYAMVERLGVEQLSCTNHTATYAAAAVYLYKYDNAAAQRLLGIGTIVIPKSRAGKRPLPDDATLVAETDENMVYGSPSSPLLEVVQVDEVQIVSKTDYLTQVTRWWESSTGLDAGHQVAIVPEPVATLWPAALPLVSRVPWDHTANITILDGPTSGNERLTAQIETPIEGLYAMLRQSFHSRWQIMVNGTPRTGVWLSPGYLGIALDKGVNQVDVQFPTDPWRVRLFWLSLAILATLGFVAAIPTHKRTMPSMIAHRGHPTSIT